jgi:hypothetical protein
MQNRLARSSALVAASVGYGALLVFLRGAPSVRDDAGVFLSVAARLLDGDRLYADVYDNKDPLFFYVEAAALGVGGWRAPFALDVLWVAIAALSTSGLLRAIGASRLIAAVGFVVYPLLLTGTWYYAGYSMLAALALTPAIGWLWARGSWGWAGGVLGAALLLKINLVLVLVATPLVLSVLRRPGESPWRRLARAGAGLAAVLGAAVAFLAARGELAPYLEMLRENVSYANDVLVYTGREGNIAGHVRTAAGDTPHFWLVVALFLITGALALWTLVRSLRGGARATPEAVLGGLFLACGGATALTLALTAAWDHHLQMLAFPGVLLVTFLVASAWSVARATQLRVAGTCAALGISLFLLGGTDAPGGADAPRSRWWSDVRSYTAEAMEAARAERLPGARTITYAHLGQNDEEGHAAFLDGSFELACSRFHQYVHTHDLDAVLRCLDERRPQLVVVTSSFRFYDEAPERWNLWVDRGRSFLQRRYEHVLRLETPRGPVEVWIARRG